MGKERDAPLFLPKLYLWCMSVPVFLMFLLKSIQGKVQANWAAPAYYTGLILTIAIFENRYAASTSSKQKKRIAIYSWSSILLSGILVLFLHNPEYLVRLGIPMKAKYDLTHRLRGWNELGQQVSSVKEEMMIVTPHPQLFIFSDSYQIASELAFYVTLKPQTYCINLGRRMNQYDIWDGWDKLTGQNAIYVTDSQDELSNIITTVFSNCELAKQVPIYLYGEKIREFYIYKCYNFRGLNTIPITNY
jgi:undecaprenyl-diphosphatase